MWWQGRWHLTKKLIKALLTKRKKCISKLLLLAEKSKADRETTEQMGVGGKTEIGKQEWVCSRHLQKLTGIKHKIMGFQKMLLHRRGC